MRFVKGIAFLLAVLALAFAGFFVWASSGTLAEDELAVLTIDEDTVRRAAPHDTFTVMTYNIGYLSATTNNRPVKTTAAFFAENKAAAAALIRRVDPDLIAFSTGANHYPEMRHLASALKEELDRPILFGGILMTPLCLTQLNFRK